MNRRKFLKRSAIVSSVGFVAYSAWRGFRYPPLMYVLKDEENDRTLNGIEINLQEAILVKPDSPIDVYKADVALRAFSPEPTVQLKNVTSSQLKVVMNNVHAESLLSVDGAELSSHEIEGTNHILVLNKFANGNATIKFEFPRPDHYRFATIGDTGGDKELYWCLKRMAGKGADFILHLGDFVYQEGDYQQAIEYFYGSRVPCYVSIGNHDFHKNGKIFQPYLDYLGVFNHAFKLGDVRFVNIDSANDFFPPWAGQRGQLMEALAEPSVIQAQNIQETIVFSHRPLVDYRDGEDHGINGVHEAKWLHKQFLKAQVSLFFAGHIHDRHELDHQGVLQVIAGQGLGHQDLLLGRKVSEFVLADVIKGQKVQHTWQGLIMPTKLHCNSVHLKYLRKKSQSDLLEVYNKSGRLCENLRQGLAKL